MSSAILPSPAEKLEKKGRATGRATGHITVQDVAREVGVSKTTAASVLRNAPNFQVSDLTRQRVLDAAKTLGYRRHAVAVALSSGCTNTVGLILPLAQIDARLPISRIYGQDIFVAVFQAASRAGLRVTAIPVPQGANARMHLQDVTDRSVDGLVIASFHDAEFVRQVYEAGIPCVEIGSGHGPCLFHPDNEGGAARAIDHLVSLGHRRIVHWRGGGENYASLRRLQGFCEATTRHGLNDSLVLSSAEEVTALLRLPAAQRPTALFAYNDYQALLTLDIAKGIGLRVPEDLSVVGFDDNVLAEAARPQLTTVRNPLGQQGDAAIQFLQALWRGERQPQTAFPVPFAIATELVVRHSTAPAPAETSSVPF